MRIYVCAVWRVDPRYGLSGPPAFGKHIERFVSACELLRTYFHRGTLDETFDVPQSEPVWSRRPPSRPTPVRTFQRTSHTDRLQPRCRSKRNAGTRGRRTCRGSVRTRVSPGDHWPGEEQDQATMHFAQPVPQVAEMSSVSSHRPPRKMPSMAIAAARTATSSTGRGSGARQFRGRISRNRRRDAQWRRFELAAWEVHECGKPWAEADADVAEAIDFCVYYAAEIRPARHAGADVAICRVKRTRTVTGRTLAFAVVIAPGTSPSRS